MDIEAAIKTRRSVRNFSDRPVDRESVRKMIEAAVCAPSACNVQGWKFIVVKDQKLKEKTVEAGGSVLIGKAPLGILVLYDNQTKSFNYRDDIQSASAAIENMILTAVSEGLSTCWICHLPAPGILRKIFNIPGNFSPVAYVLLGYGQSSPQPMPRKYSLDQVIAYDGFSKNWPRVKKSWLKVMLGRILIRIYYLTPVFIKKRFLNKLVDKTLVKKFDN